MGSTIALFKWRKLKRVDAMERNPMAVKMEF